MEWKICNKKNLAIYDLLSRYESNRKKLFETIPKKLMSFVKHALFNSAVAFVDVFRNIVWTVSLIDNSSVEYLLGT